MKIKTLFGRWDEYGRSVTIEVEHDEGRSNLVHVLQGKNLSDGSPEIPKISWSSIGFVSKNTAAAVAHALEGAVIIASEMEKVTIWERITPPEEGLCWAGEGMPEIHIQHGKVWVNIEGWEQEDKP